jgi:hypothetical protein
MQEYNQRNSQSVSELKQVPIKDTSNFYMEEAESNTEKKENEQYFTEFQKEMRKSVLDI